MLKLKGDDMSLYTLKLIETQDEQLRLCGVGSNEVAMPTEDCVKDWWRQGRGDKYFWKHETYWSNEQVFREIYQSLTYFIKKWQ
jgi:hypothetical protein